MPDPSVPFGALASAVRERLLTGASAVLPGLGTLARVHVPARVQAQPDGTRVLLPPGETIGLTRADGDPAPLAALLVRHLGTPQADPAAALRSVLDQAEARLAATGDVQLPGVGTFQRTSSGVRFAAAPDLLGSVNRPFAGLPAVTAPPPSADPERAAARPLAPSAETAAETAHDVATGVDEPVPLSPAVPSQPSPLATDTQPEPPPAEPAPSARAPGRDARDEPFDRADADDPPAWTPAMPASDTLGVPEDIEDAEFSVVAPAAAAAAPPLAPLPSDPAPVTSTEASDAPPPAETTQAGEPGPTPAAVPVVPLASDTLPVETDADRSGWQYAAGWVLIALALGALSAAWIWSQRDTADTAPPVAEAMPEEVAPAAARLLAPDTVASDSFPPPVAERRADTSATLPPTPAPTRPVTPNDASTPSRSPDPEPGRRPGVAPQRGQAILPPRVAGLSPEDTDALASQARVDPSRGGTTWVVLATASESDAETLAARYRSAGYRTGVLYNEGSARPYRVAVGQFETREQALRLRDRLPPQAPPDTWPLRLR